MSTAERGNGRPAAGSAASRQERERMILQIVDARSIHTQAELVDALSERGIEVTQATVSRDVRRLGLVKTRGAEGDTRYARPSSEAQTAGARRALRSALRELATGATTGSALLAIRTQIGAANAVAVAMDRARLPGVVATLAGDDTIFVLSRSAADRARLLEEVQALLRE